MRIDRGDEVVVLENTWHEGIDIGQRLAKVLDTSSYVTVEVYDYNNNPVRLFRSDVEVLTRHGEQESDFFFDEEEDRN